MAYLGGHTALGGKSHTPSPARCCAHYFVQFDTAHSARTRGPHFWTHGQRAGFTLHNHRRHGRACCSRICGWSLPPYRKPSAQLPFRCLPDLRARPGWHSCRSRACLRQRRSNLVGCLCQRAGIRRLLLLHGRILGRPCQAHESPCGAHVRLWLSGVPGIADTWALHGRSAHPQRRAGPLAARFSLHCARTVRDGVACVQ